MKPIQELEQIASVQDKLANANRKLTVLVAKRKLPFFENVVIKEEKPAFVRFVLTILEKLGLFIKNNASNHALEKFSQKQVKLAQANPVNLKRVESIVNKVLGDASQAKQQELRADNLHFQNESNKRDWRAEGEELRTAKQLYKANHQTAERYRERIAGLKRELESLNSRIEGLEKDGADKGAAVTQLNRERLDLEQRLERANQEARRAEADAKLNGDALKQMKEANDFASSLIIKSGKRIADLELQLGQVVDTASKFEQKAVLTEELLSKARIRLRTTEKLLSSKAAHAATSKATAEHLGEEIKKLEKMLEESNKNLEELTDEFQRMSRESDEAHREELAGLDKKIRAGYEEKVEGLKRQNADLAKELSQYQQRVVELTRGGTHRSSGNWRRKHK